LISRYLLSRSQERSSSERLVDDLTCKSVPYLEVLAGELQDKASEKIDEAKAKGEGKFVTFLYDNIQLSFHEQR
jgi:hypothetical protein